MSEGILNLDYLETLDKVDSYEEYIMELKKIEDKIWWEKATKQNTKRSYEKYLTNYSSGIYSFEAREKINKFVVRKREKELEQELIRKDFEKLIEWADEKNISEDRLPRDIDKLSKLKELNLHNSNLNSLPNEIKVLKDITEIHLSRNHFTEVPKVLEKFDKLTWISIINTDIKEIPNFFRKYKTLEGLFFYGTPIEKLPEWIGEFTELAYLSLPSGINNFPDTFYNLKKLYKLEMFGSGKNLSSAIKNFKNLEILIIGNCDTLEFPKYLSELNLRALELYISSEVKEFPKFIKKLTNLERLKISGGNIKKIPDWICELIFLEEVDLYWYSIEEIPDNLNILKFLNKETKENIERVKERIKEENERIEKEDTYSWNHANRDNISKSYQKYLDNFPNGIYKNEALKRLKELEEEEEFYKSIQIKDDIDDYKTLLEKYPNGKYYREILSNKITPLILQWFEKNNLENEHIYKEFKEFYLSKSKWNKFEWFSLFMINKEVELSLPEELKYFKDITIFKLYKCSIKILPNWISKLSNIEILEIENTQMNQLPKDIKKLVKLKEIRLWDNNFSNMPMEIYNITSLEKIEFREVNLNTDKCILFPNILQNLENLKELTIYYKNHDYNFLKIESIPDWIGNLTNLEKLSIPINKQLITQLPENIKNLKNMKSLPFDIYIDEYPQILNWIKSGHFPKLEYICFSEKTEKIPEEIKELKYLKNIQVNGHLIEEIPEWIDIFSKLERLNVKSFKVKTLPNSIGNLSNLKEIDLTYTSLKEIPSTICNLKNLKNLYVNYEFINKIPKCIAEKFSYMHVVEKALNRIKSDKSTFKEISAENTKIAYKYYLKHFPEGIYKNEAEKKVEELPDDGLFKKLFYRI